MNKILGKRLYNLRKEAGLSTVDVAAQLGISHQQIAKYEKGIDALKVTRLMDICAILNITTTYFLMGIESKREREKC